MFLALLELSLFKFSRNVVVLVAGGILVIGNASALLVSDASLIDRDSDGSSDNDNGGGASSTAAHSAFSTLSTASILSALSVLSALSTLPSCSGRTSSGIHSSRVDTSGVFVSIGDAEVNSISGIDIEVEDFVIIEACLDDVWIVFEFVLIEPCLDSVVF